jgi:hypothetical protein
MLYCLKTKRARKILSLFLVLMLHVTLVLPILLNRRVAHAAKLADGTWSQSASPGTTTVTFTNTGALTAGDFIVLTFPSQATLNGSGTNISVTNQTTPGRANNTTDRTITITLDASINASTAITITMTDALSAYTTTTFAQQSLGINTIDSTGPAIDYGVGIKTNDNTTDVTATVPLFVTMAIDTTTIGLGTLSTASVKEADQTYTTTSNNTTGVTIQIATDGNLDSGANDIDYVGDGTVTAGSEEYGISVDNVSGLTIDADYNSGDNDIIQAANNIATSTGTVNGATFDINYKASISGNTVAGTYAQVVTVTVATNS